jgi:hypothetical protein
MLKLKKVQYTKKHLLQDLSMTLTVLMCVFIGTYIIPNRYIQVYPRAFASASSNFYGLNWHPIWIDPSVQDSEIALFKAAGVKSVRFDVPWYNIEYTQGVYSQTYLSRLDNAVNELLANGIDPLAIITSAPPWVTGAPSGDPSPSSEPPLRTIIGPNCNPSLTNCTPYNGVAEYDNFLSFIMQRWLGKVNEYEIWNEPDGGWSWQYTDDNYPNYEIDNATDYTTLLKSAYTTAKAIDPSVTILGGSLSGTDGNNQVFLQTMYEQGAKNYFDVLSQHYYCDPPGDNWCAYNGTAASRNIIDPGTLADTWKNNIYPIMEKYGDGSKPVWVTETGYNTYTAGGGITESEQATYLTQSYEDAASLPNVARLYWYDADCTDSGTSTQDYYCIIDVNTYDVSSLPTPILEPAYYALQDLTAASSSTTGTGSSSSGSSSTTGSSTSTNTGSSTTSSSGSSTTSSSGSTSSPTTGSSSNTKSQTSTSSGPKSSQSATPSSTVSSSTPNTVNYSIDGNPTSGPVNPNKLGNGTYTVTQTINSGGHITTKSQIITVDHKSFWQKIISSSNVKYAIGSAILLMGTMIFIYWVRAVIRRHAISLITSVSEPYKPIIVHPGADSTLNDSFKFKQ